MRRFRMTPEVRLMDEWRFYVYELVDGCGVVQYVGKGSGRRLAASARARGVSGHEVARFKREQDAYAFEVARIAELSPSLNVAKGGNGARATPIRRTKTKFEREIDAIGPRVYAARLWLRFAPNTDANRSIVDRIRAVAYG